jgi:hypothetical protein
MSLDQQLRRASNEIHDTFARRRGTPIGELARRSRILRMAAVGTAAAAFVAITIGVTTLALHGPTEPTVAPVGDEQTTVTSTPGTTSPLESTTPSTAAPATGGSFPEGWPDDLADAEVILEANGIALALVPGVAEEGGWALAIMVGGQYQAAGYVGGVGVGIGTIDGDSEDEVTVFAVAPLDAAALRIEYGADTPVVLDQVVTRPDVGYAFLIGTGPRQAITRETIAQGIEMTAFDADGNPLYVFARVMTYFETGGRYEGQLSTSTFGTPPVDTTAMVIDSITVDTIPNVIACQAPDGITPPPFQGGTVTWVGTYPTPTEALAAFLADEVGDPPIVRAGYVEMIEPDGSITYGVDFGDGFVTLISVTPVDGGWTVDSWDGSGC